MRLTDNPSAVRWGISHLVAPGFFGEYCVVVPKTDPATFVAVGITPGDAWATARDKLVIEGKQMEAGYEIIRISEEEYRAFRKK